MSDTSQATARMCKKTSKAHLGLYIQIFRHRSSLHIVHIVSSHSLIKESFKHFTSFVHFGSIFQFMYRKYETITKVNLQLSSY